MTIRNGLSEAIGDTPLVRLRRVSAATGCEILGKAEFPNPVFLHSKGLPVPAWLKRRPPPLPVGVMNR